MSSLVEMLNPRYLILSVYLAQSDMEPTTQGC